MIKVLTAMQRLLKDESGNFGLMTALLVPVLFLGGSVALNIANATKEASKMQDALDAAAIKAVRSYGEGESENAVRIEANRLFFANFQTPSAADGYNSASPERPAVEFTFSENGQETRASAFYAAQYNPVFFGLKPFVISRRSVAARLADREACILALHPTASRAIEVSGSAAVDTSNCTITSNSDDSQSIYLSGTATLTAECLYATGKVYATLAHLELACGQAREGVSRTPDPFKKKAFPTAGNWVNLSGCGQGFVGNGGGNGDCNGTGKTPNKVPDGYSVTLKPGTYGELEIKGKVTLQPGNYLIDGGVLKFASQSAVSGEGVTFFLLNGAEIDLHGGSNFHVTAATSGEWAGFVIVSARNNTEPAVINGNSNSSLSGIIYMPASKEIQYSGNGSSGGECVRIIAQEITLIGNSGFAIDCKSELADNQILNPGAIRLVQ
ncbi:TadE/TadG family type IV pilus assembly protein [Sinorhizobium fredii]|uniref:TadE/TadG family type IV pilus assembly protein n=1 Tax=Rhizobium fredii TaxID=380 RepID=UPI0012969FBD|nr:TadE/TadG family type IV pilus assembly protein [Sinorhizobium fredii]MQW98162.1 pilus assembly protein [Sinorhizobium fredii]UTY45554.1 pilus assembly protein [Sinorhizobium fredii]